MESSWSTGHVSVKSVADDTVGSSNSSLCRSLESAETKGVIIYNSEVRKVDSHGHTMKI